MSDVPAVCDWKVDPCRENADEWVTLDYGDGTPVEVPLCAKHHRELMSAVTHRIAKGKARVIGL